MRPRLIRQVNTGSTLGQIMYRELKASHGALPLINPPLGSAPKGISPSYRPIKLSANRIRTWLRQSHGTRIDTICHSAVLLLAN